MKRRPRIRPALTLLVSAGVASALAATSLAVIDSQPHLAGSTAEPTPVDPLPPVRAIYGESDSPRPYQALQELGANTVHVRADRHLLNLLWARGMKAVVWLGEYHRQSCRFEFTDDQVELMVRHVARHPAIVAYQIADEPRATNCPTSPDDIRARAELVKSIDPEVPTYLTVDSWNGREAFPYDDFAGTTDIMGLVVYPCESGSCDLSVIDDAIRSADEAGVERYWAVVQAFADSYYSMPDPATFEAQLERWTASDAEGIAIFAWNFGADDVARSPEIQDVIRDAWLVDEPTPTPSPTLPPTPPPDAAQPTWTPTEPTAASDAGSSASASTRIP